MQTQLIELDKQAESDLRVNSLIATLKEQRDAAYNIMVNQAAELKISQTRNGVNEQNIRNLVKELTDKENELTQANQEIAELKIIVLNLQSQLPAIESENNNVEEGKNSQSDVIEIADRGDKNLKKVKA